MLNASASSSSSLPSSQTQLNLTTEQLHTFLHLTTQAPLESVCRSSLYVLSHIPAGRQGVLEYLSTFYKVATFLHLRYQINLRSTQQSSSSADLAAEASSLVQINQAIEIIETDLGELLVSRANDLWSLEIVRWLADMLGDIVHNTATTCADSMQGLSSDEIASFKSPTINDGLEIWSKQCKPVQSLLQLVLRTYKASLGVETKSQIIDILLETSSKYPKKYDWTLAYFSCLDTEMFIRKLLDIEFSALSSSSLSKQKQAPPQRSNVVNFVAKSYPNLTYEQTMGFLDRHDEDKENRRVVFILRLAAHSPALFTVLLNRILDSSSPILVGSLRRILDDDDDARSRDELFNCLSQLNNSIGVFEILCNLLDLVSLEIRPAVSTNCDYYKKICQYAIEYIDELISSIYKSLTFDNSNSSGNKQPAWESIGFLKSLNQIDGYSYHSLVKSVTKTLKNLVSSLSDSTTTTTTTTTTTSKWPNNNELELVYKLALLMMISTNEYKAGVVMRELVTLESRTSSSWSKSSHSLDETVLVKIRQEVASFHCQCFGDAVKSLVNYFANVADLDQDVGKLAALVSNLVLVYDWDVQNKYSMNQSVSNILLDRECFVGLMRVLRPGELYSLHIMELYNRIFKQDDEDSKTIKLTINDLVQCSHLFVDYFFDLSKSVDETNVASKVKEVNETLTLLENTVFQQFNSLDENNPYRNILLRNLLEKLFESLAAVSDDKKDVVSESNNEDMFDENSNLFTLNVESINSELITNKSRLKAVRNSLITNDSIKRNRLQIKNQFKSFRNLALVEFIEVICQSESGSDSKQRRMSSDQLTNLSDLLVQNILLEQHFVDYQWSSVPSLIDIEESFESELESIKIFVERDMSVQNKVENHVDNQIIWILLELIASDEQAFIRVGPIIRSLLSSVIIQWESLQETPTRNMPKALGTTIRLLNIINRVPNFLVKPLCYIVDIVPFLNSYETFIALMIIWRSLKKCSFKRKMTPSLLSNTNKPIVTSESNKDIKHLRYIFQKNMSKLSCLYAKFFKNRV